MIAVPLLSLLAAAEPAPARWASVLIAGQGEIPAFGNAVTALRDRLSAGGHPVVELRPDADGDPRLTGVVHALGGLDLGPGDGCFVYLTSHGLPAGALIGDDPLAPSHLRAALDLRCGDRPTVVVVSACYAGTYLSDPEMWTPTRVVLTAARADRSSFGCSAENTYTVYDACFLDALAGAARWTDVHDRASACVAREERALGGGLVPSEPQAWFGSEVADLAVPAALSGLVPPPAAALATTPDELAARRARGEKLLVVVSADWCAACKRFAPVFDRGAARHPTVPFLKLDADAWRDATAGMGVTQLPQLFLVDGPAVYRVPDAPDDAALDGWVEKLRAHRVRPGG